MYINYTYYYIGKSNYTFNLTTHVLSKTDFPTYLFVFFSAFTVTKFNRTDYVNITIPSAYALHIYLYNILI